MCLFGLTIGCWFGCWLPGFCVAHLVAVLSADSVLFCRPGAAPPQQLMQQQQQQQQRQPVGVGAAAVGPGVAVGPGAVGPRGPPRPPPHGAIPVQRPLPPGQPTMGVPAHGTVGYASGVRPPPYPGRVPPTYQQAERKPALLQVGQPPSCEDPGSAAVSVSGVVWVFEDVETGGPLLLTSHCLTLILSFSVGD